MSLERFIYEYGDDSGTLFDTKHGTFYLIQDSEENIKLFCNRLNEINKKNQGLLKRITKSLIQDCCFFISGSLFICGIPMFFILEPVWCQDVGCIMFIISFCLFGMTVLHETIFG